MFVNYFQDLFKLFCDSFKFSFKNFKKIMPYTWAMIILQIVGYMGILFSFLSFESGLYDVLNILKLIFSSILYLCGLFFMFKKIFSFLSDEFDCNNFSFLKTFKALLVLALFNLIPLLVFALGILTSKFFPDLTIVLQRIVNIFSIVFYFSLSFSIAEIARQKRNLFLSVFNSIKIFFKSFPYSLPLMIMVYIIAFALKFLILTICIYLFLVLKLTSLIQVVSFFDSILSVLSIYFFATLYLGVQVGIIRKTEEK